LKNYIYPVLVTFIAIAAVIASELLIIVGFLQLPIDITGNFYWLGLLPGHLIIVGLIVLILRGLFAWNRNWYVPLFIIVFSGFYVFYLTSFFNPLETVIQYLASAIPVCLFWFGLRWSKLSH